MARFPERHDDPFDGLLDPETLDSPRRLSRDERRAVLGTDWSWTQADHQTEDRDD